MLMLHVCLAVKEILSSNKYLTNKETRVRGVKSVPFRHQKSFSFEWIKVLCYVLQTEMAWSGLLLAVYIHAHCVNVQALQRPAEALLMTICVLEIFKLRWTLKGIKGCYFPSFDHHFRHIKC